jgi:hypothetical protein
LVAWPFSSSTARAEPLPAPTPPSLRSELLAHFGVTTAPFEVPALPEAKGHAFVFLGRATYVPSPQWEWELQVPWVMGSVAQPAGSYVDASSLGNPQLGVRWRLAQQTLGISGASVRRFWAGVDLGAPLARGADDLMTNRLLAIADGIEGRAHLELLTPGVFPITPSATSQLVHRRWELAAEVRLPVLLRVSDAHLTNHGSTTRTLGLASTFALEARYRLSQRLSLASAAHLTVDLTPVARRPPGASHVQDLERLSLHVHFGSQAALAIDLQAPLGGDLGGNTVAAGLRFALDLQ